jgi:hypothetical protein
MFSFDLLAYVPTWVTPFILITASVLFFVTRFSEAFEGALKVVPVFGKYWRKRALERQEDKNAELMQLAESLVSKLPRPDYEVLCQELEHVKQRLQYMESMELINQAYLIEDAKWHNHVDVAWGEDPDPHFALPPRLPYTEFVRKWRDEKWRPNLDRPI